MPRPIPLATKLAQAFRTVEKMKCRGRNTERHYPFLRASDLFDALRLELFKRNVLLLPNEGTPEYVTVAQSNGGEQITECRLPVAYTFKDAAEEIGPYTVHGIGRDVTETSLYKAQTGSRKALLKAVGLIAWDEDDPEYSGQRPTETLDDVAPRRTPRKEQPIRDFEISAFTEACAATCKKDAEVSEALLTRFKVASIAELKRKDFKSALTWASNGGGTLTLAPKPQAVPHQGSLPLPTPAPPSINLKIGSKTVAVEPQKGSYAL